MSTRIQFPRMEILQALYDLTEPVAPHRFISSRPAAVPEPMDRFLLISLPAALRDRGDTYQSARGRITIFARDIQGLESTLALEQMQSAILSLFPIATARFHAKAPSILPGGSDGAGFHSIIIQFNITIFKQP